MAETKTEGKVVVGKKAPAFTALDQDGAKVALKDLAGQWVVLYFYPKDDTPGCTTEACEFTDGIKGFTGLNALVLGCSPDTPEKHRDFIAKYKLKVRLLSDPKRELLEKYGAFGEKKLYGKTVQGVLRSTVIIDPQGKVAHHWATVKAAGHAAKVREKLAALQAG